MRWGCCSLLRESHQDSRKALVMRSPTLDQLEFQFPLDMLLKFHALLFQMPISVVQYGIPTPILATALWFLSTCFKFSSVSLSIIYIPNLVFRIFYYSNEWWIRLDEGECVRRKHNFCKSRLSYSDINIWRHWNSISCFMLPAMETLNFALYPPGLSNLSISVYSHKQFFERP